MRNLKLASVLLLSIFFLSACCPMALRCDRSVIVVKPKVPKILLTPAANKDLADSLKNSQGDVPKTQ